MAAKGRIATAQGKSLEHVRAARRMLNDAEKSIKDGYFLTGEASLGQAERALRGARTQAQFAHMGLLSVQRPTG